LNYGLNRDCVAKNDDAGAACIAATKQWGIVTAATATTASINGSCNTIATTISTTCATAARASCPASLIGHALVAATTAATCISGGKTRNSRCCTITASATRPRGARSYCAANR
jgi:hypothetical protein